MGQIELNTRSSFDGEVIEGPFYEAAKKVYPRSRRRLFPPGEVGGARRGAVRLLPAAVRALESGAGPASQAVLVDLAHRRFYFFWIEIWPQEVYYFTGLLIIAGMTLFLMNALAGRVWCGYMCPQTVWTDLFLTVERWIEGDRRERMMRRRRPARVRLVAAEGRQACDLAVDRLVDRRRLGALLRRRAALVVSLLTFQAPFVAYG